MLRVLPVLFLILCVPMQVSAQTDPHKAAEFINQLGGEAVEVLRDQSMTLAQREDALSDIVSKNFDVNLIGKYVLGDAWDTASPEQRDEYLDLFTTYVLKNYTQRLGGYSGQTLKIDGSRDYKGRDAVVSTTILQDGGDPINVAWLVRETNQGLRILDVIVGGKSLTLAQKKEFQSVIAREDLTGLLQLLRIKVSKYSVQS